MGGLFMEIPTALIILCAVFLALGILSFFLPGRLKPLFGVILLIAFVGSVAFLYWTGGFKDILAVIPPTVAEQIEDAVDTVVVSAKSTYETSKCYTKVNPDLVNACLKGLEEKKEESIKKLGPYETIELKWGRRLNGDYDYDLPESGQDYTLDVTFINKNKEIYEINFPEGKVHASTKVTAGPNEAEVLVGPKSVFEKYILDPGEELPLRFRFGLENDPKKIDFDWECIGSQTFAVNATTEQKSGGWSDFGMAPSDEDDYRKFIHGFQPNINAEPGPLNIYVFTDPYGIDVESFRDNPLVAIEIIIKIQNKVKDGTALIKKLYLVQEFEVPDRLFEIDESTCEGTKGIKLGTNFTVGPFAGVDDLCPNKNYRNCLLFDFVDPGLEVKPNEKITISCYTKTGTSIKPPSHEYTDQIRVFSSFEYTQEWTKAIECAI